MSIDIIPINGKSQYLDYEVFEKSVNDTIGKKCSEAKIFLFNNFPVSVSVETNIDLIIVIAIEDKKGNYYIPKSRNNKPIYFHNQIIPIKFITQFQDDSITYDESGQIIANDEYIDYSAEINALRFSLINYLADKCGFNRKELYIQPLIFIQNNNEAVYDNYLIAKSFDFHTIHKYFSKNQANIFIAYKNWKTDYGYQNLSTDIERITNQASKDSEIGYLTKKKINRIAKQLSSSRVLFDELNKNLIIVNGKAGTGKSSELLLLTMKCISNGQNTLFLTYNKLLIFDIARTIRSFVNAKLNNENENKPGEGSVMTLHAFFFRLSKSLGVLHVLKAERIEKLMSILKTRMRQVYDVINQEFKSQNNNYDELKTKIQNHDSFDIGTKEVGIDFINYLQNRGVNSSNELNKNSIAYFNNKKRIVGNIEAKDVFLADYYGVLENTLLQIESPEKFYEKYKIEDKHELLDIAIGLSKKYEGEKDGKKTITEKGFIEFKNRRIGGFRRKRTIFIDEAQDCHWLEKEILISIYGSSNIVVANGGKEQLIRHVELCNWEVSKARKLSIKKHSIRNKSYRMKKTIVDFCNFIAEKYRINLNLEPLDSEDEGELLIDFRQTHNESEISDIFSHLYTKGEVNGCLPYETLLVLLESNTQREGLNGENLSTLHSTIINEYSNIEDSPHLKRGTWKYLRSLEKNYMFWDGTVEDKSQLIVPSSFESRLIYYESCRGLEAWSVACFALDKFFNQKKEDPDAERFLVNEEKDTNMQSLFISNEDRKKMYAATWILMAITRVIDTLYIQINNSNSEFGKLVKEYLNQKNENVREIGNNASS
ncbi:AAA family ATPase [Candidatus Sulfidibacterium hydrothermale]|uniref:AAA family ATPase n=1 Tax=Candidatus Sulfidibacterium hydrothermale TaxID=2875962 RepID=UPI001F0B39C9|nr:AAA family ATPase [Candidatus Sulfidibacterium hydrothermale]UBM61341.1 AAA family ATPase [Candidatus Sulfidibacterium hydrothermale]